MWNLLHSSMRATFRSPTLGATADLSAAAVIASKFEGSIDFLPQVSWSICCGVSGYIKLVYLF